MLSVSLVLQTVRIWSVQAATSGPTFSIVNPGPSSNPSNWTASKVPRDFGTSQFLFINNETIVGSTFLVNVTVADVDTLLAWQIGILYDRTVLQCVGGGIPSDNVFAEAEQKGLSIVAPGLNVSQASDNINEVKWGATVNPSFTDPWSFNGTGTLAQLRFSIVKQVESNSAATTSLSFDSEWTKIIHWPEYDVLVDVQNLQNGFFTYQDTNYSGPNNQSVLDFYRGVLVAVVVVAIFVVGVLVFLRSRRSKH